MFGIYSILLIIVYSLYCLFLKSMVFISLIDRNWQSNIDVLTVSPTSSIVRCCSVFGFTWKKVLSGLLVEIQINLSRYHRKWFVSKQTLIFLICLIYWSTYRKLFRLKHTFLFSRETVHSYKKYLPNSKLSK